MTPSTRIVLRAELVARAVPLQPVLREHAGTGEADGRGSGPSPDRRRLLPHLHTDQIRRLRRGHPNRGYADRACSRAMGGYAAQQALEAIHTLFNVHRAGGFAEKNRMQLYWRDANTVARIPDSTPSWVARFLASHYWRSRSESARWCNCGLARALVGLDRARARSP
jgi:hypothetical protein